jgi:hypothetical protein
MGFNTTVVILNDVVHNIAEDPTFGQRLADAISSGDSSRHELQNGVQVIESHHADYTTVVAVGGNMGICLGTAIGCSVVDDPVAIVRSLARDLGFDLRKRPERKD